VFERKIIRMIYGSIYSQRNWKIRTNREIDLVIGHEDTVNFIKSMRIRWLGHVEGMSNHRMPKMILNAKMEGDRKRRRPNKRWINDVERDLRKLGIRNWRSRAGDRQRWRAVVREAKVHPGLQSWRSSILIYSGQKWSHSMDGESGF
jgi:hypothetical protein